MDEAINSQIEHFLIKPVNPSQIFMACKQSWKKVNFKNRRLQKIIYLTLMMSSQN